MTTLFDPSQNQYVRQVGIAIHADEKNRKKTLKKIRKDIEKDDELKQYQKIEAVKKVETENTQGRISAHTPQKNKFSMIC